MSTPAATKTDLLLLGLLLDRPMHGYELYQQIQAEGIDAWFNISAAGVYYSLRKLRDQGLVAESRQHRGGSTRKSIYRLTDKGRTAFFEAMETELASQEETYLDYDLAIYLLNRMPLQRAIPRLEATPALSWPNRPASASGPGSGADNEAARRSNWPSWITSAVSWRWSRIGWPMSSAASRPRTRQVTTQTAAGGD